MYMSCVSFHAAHMWFDMKIHDANTNEDPHHPEITKRVRDISTHMLRSHIFVACTE